MLIHEGEFGCRCKLKRLFCSLFRSPLRLPISLPVSTPYFDYPIQLPNSTPHFNSPFRSPFRSPSQLPIPTPQPTKPNHMPDLSGFHNLRWITKFAGKGSKERQAKERIRSFFPHYLQSNSKDDYTARVSELDFSTACRVGAHVVLAPRSVNSLSVQQWEAAKSLLT